MKKLIPTLPSFYSSYCPRSFTYKWTYDVFLNFRGEDTRNGFTGYLYDALREKGIHPFIDNRLERGKEITSALLQAIDESRIAIVILSVNYATSTFCLDELIKILECNKQKNRLVLPIFYKVDPSDVRQLRGSYREALATHEAKFKNNKERVQNWKSAPHKIANLSGWHFTERDGYEYEFVKKIVEKVSKRINHTSLYIPEYPIGLKSRVEDVFSLLDFEYNKGVVMVGIHGIGGIGKTTIASAVHNVIADQFEDVCFLYDIRERSNKLGSSEYDLVELQKTLLLDLTGEKEIKIENVRKGISTISRRLCQKKILLFLDDVDTHEQLKALAGRVDWFGCGSRIIITTRDKHLLDVHGVNRNYEVNELHFGEALELFSWNAFQKKEVDSSYASISNCVIEYCKGLPLALEIIGSNLFAKTQEEWKSALDTYEKIPQQKIQNVLKVSYDGLEEPQREIFLDIACFFKDYKSSYVKNILLNGRDYDPEYHIGVLVKKSLIKIDQHQKVRIHDLVAQMGKEIVRSHSPLDPGNWSRLWSSKDILCVLEEDKGTDKIEALVLNMPRCKEVQWNGKAFNKMKNLKTLIIKSACFSCEPKYLPNSLRVLKWKNYPSSALPVDFHPRNLTIFSLPGSSLRLIKPSMNFTSLTKMNLSFCQSLIQVPDVSEAANLRELDISYCQNLIEVHSSVGFLDKLVSLRARKCPNLSTLPCSIKSTSLESLDLSCCFNLQSVPQITGVIKKLSMSNFERELEYGIKWEMEDCLFLGQKRGNLVLQCDSSMLPILEKWKDGFEHFSGDNQERANPTVSVALDIRDFYRNLTNEYFPPWRPYYPSLTSLQLQFNNLTDDFLHQRLAWFPHLNYLDLTGNKFIILPECMNECRYLKTLILDNCKDLEEIKGIPPNITHFSAIDCVLLTSQSTSKLLRQDFHMNRVKDVTVPGIKIPKWLDYNCMTLLISFWCRNEFPRLALCSIHTGNGLKINVSINRKKQIKSKYYKFGSQTLCTSLINVHNEQRKIMLKKNEWNRVHVYLGSDDDAYISGVHVYKAEINMDNVLFIHPDSLQRTDNISRDMDLITLSKQFCPFLGMQVLDTIDSRKQDENYYHLLNNDKFDALSFKEHLQNPIWIMEAPTTVKVLMLKIVEHSLPTCNILFCRKLVNSPLCPICEKEIETIQHVFFKCPWTQPIWFGSNIGRILNDSFMKLKYEIFEMNHWLCWILHRMKDVYPNAKKATGLLGNICWAIWRARNEFVLCDKPVDPWEASRTIKALGKSYYSNSSLLQIEKTYGPTLETLTDTTHQDLQHNEYFTSINSENGKGTEVEYRGKPKRKLVSHSIIETEPTCDKERIDTSLTLAISMGTTHQDLQHNKYFTSINSENGKGTEVEYKAKPKRKLVSNSDNETESTCDKERIDTTLTLGISRSTTHQDLQHNEYFASINSENVKGTEVECKTSPKRKRVSNSIIEIEPTCDEDTEHGSKVKRKRNRESNNNTKVEPTHDKENQNPLNAVNDDLDPFEYLEFVLSSSSPSSLEGSSHIVPFATLQQEEINKVIDGIGNFLNKNLEDIFNNSKEQASFDNIFKILETTNDKEISVRLKSYIISLKESVEKILAQYSLCENDVKAFTTLEVEKQEIQQLCQVGKKEKKDIDDEILKCKTVMESHTIGISSLEQQLSALQQKLEDAKACHETNSQKMLALQAQKKNICENARSLVERGKKVMESRVLLQSKHDDALIQLDSLKKQWITLKDTFLENQLKFNN